jgi:ABC-2 type transport system permease protein
LVADHKPRWIDAASSELRKLRTLRSTGWTLFTACFIVIGFCLLATFLGGSNYGQHGHSPRPLNLITGSWILGNLAFMVMGVMAITNEYATSLVVSTFLATPRRLWVWTAKIAVFGAVIGVVSFVLAFVQFFIGQAVLSTYSRVPHISLNQHLILRIVIGGALYNLVIALMGLALGAIVRQTAGAIAIFVGIWLVIPALFQALPDSWKNPLTEYWPTQAGTSITKRIPDPHTLTAWWGLGEFALVVAVLLVIAGYLVVRRDP